MIMTLRASTIGEGTFQDPLRPNVAGQVHNVFYSRDGLSCLYSTDPEEITDLNELRVDRRGLIARFEPESVSAGDSIIVQVGRAQPGETVRFTLEITGQTVDVTANSEGRLRRRLTVPLLALPGFYQVNIRGLTSRRECDIYITVV